MHVLSARAAPRCARAAVGLRYAGSCMQRAPAGQAPSKPFAPTAVALHKQRWRRRPAAHTWRAAAVQARGLQRAWRERVFHRRLLHQPLNSGGQQLRDAGQHVPLRIQLHSACGLHPGLLPLGRGVGGGSCVSRRLAGLWHQRQRHPGLGPAQGLRVWASHHLRGPADRGLLCSGVAWARASSPPGKFAAAGQDCNVAVRAYMLAGRAGGGGRGTHLSPLVQPPAVRACRQGAS